jgi:hypothetical protein
VAYSYIFDRARNLVRINVNGRDTAADNQRRIREITNDLSWSPGMDVLVDFTGTTDFDISAEGIGAIAMTQGQIDPLIGGGRLAVVASREPIYELSRLFEVLAERKGSMRVRVFRELVEAEEWLGLGPGSFAG